MLLRTLLAQHRLEPADVEAEALARVGGDDAEGLARVVRIAATNRELVRNGLRPLLFASCDEADDEPTASCGARLGFDAEEQRAVDEVGLPVADYLAVRGTFGTVMGLRLNRRAYHAAQRACTTRRARAAGADEAASKAYLRARLRSIARTAARRLGVPPDA